MTKVRKCVEGHLILEHQQTCAQGHPSAPFTQGLAIGILADPVAMML